MPFALRGRSGWAPPASGGVLWLLVATGTPPARRNAGTLRGLPRTPFTPGLGRDSEGRNRKGHVWATPHRFPEMWEVGPSLPLGSKDRYKCWTCRPKAGGHWKTFTAHLYPSNPVPRPQATELVPQAAHATEPHRGRGTRGQQGAARPSDPPPGAGEEQAGAGTRTEPLSPAAPRVAIDVRVTLAGSQVPTLFVGHYSGHACECVRVRSAFDSVG